MSNNTILATTPLVSTNYILKATGTTIGNSLIFDNGTNVGIGNTNTSYTLDVSGTGRFTGNVNIDGERLTIGGTSNNAVINNIASVRINIDCDNNDTAESFTIGKNQVGIDNNNVLFRVQENGNVGIGTSSPLGSTSERTLHLSDGGGGYATVYVTNSSNSVRSIFGMQSSANLGIVGTQSNSDFAIFTNDTRRMGIQSGGRVLINTTSVSSAGMSTGLFQVNSEIFSVGSVAGLFWENRSGGVTYNSNWYGFYTTSGQIYLYSGSANLASVNMSSGAWQGLSPSDRRLKDNIQEYDKGLKDILKLNVKQWEYNGKAKTVKGDKGVGLIADELEKVIPEFVLDYENYLEDGDAEKTTLKRVDLSELNFILVKAIQEQNQTIQELSNRLIKLESK